MKLTVAWARLIEQEPHLLDLSPIPAGNDKGIRNGGLAKLFEETPVPESVAGFECDDSDSMSEVWPEGTDAAKEVCSTPIAWTSAHK